jgi:hypothetical protein
MRIARAAQTSSQKATLTYPLSQEKRGSNSDFYEQTNFNHAGYQHAGDVSSSKSMANRRLDLSLQPRIPSKAWAAYDRCPWRPAPQ